MKKWVVVEYIIRVIALPLAVVLALNHFNICDYFSFIPQDEKFNICLMIYLGIGEGVLLLLKGTIESCRAQIVCVFYIRKSEESIITNPTVYCIEETAGVANVSYHLKLEGSAFILRTSEITIQLQDWLSSQSARNKTGFCYKENELRLSINNLLSAGNFYQNIDLEEKISFIHNDDDRTFSIEIIPNIVAPFWAKPFISFNHNTVHVKNTR